MKKSNDPTPLRPQGERLLNANLVEIDLNKYIQQIKDEVTWKESDLNSITLFKSDSMRIVLIGIHQHATIKPHQTNAVISVQVLEGEINFKTDEGEHILNKGNMITLQPKIQHSVDAIQESFFLLTTVPTA
ncbi:MAG: AraC family ligand binding domain-containing protein [Chitinophagales bacterium]|nr:AraC family ligand binding domain-containing protein [Bacteroidota bacterium]